MFHRHLLPVVILFTQASPNVENASASIQNRHLPRCALPVATTKAALLRIKCFRFRRNHPELSTFAGIVLGLL
ncbi:hypothetical protein IMCC21906_02936 [Spongiibacter sp. IMCC21906]|nr:hypothetical protein IMCC21906_02936 [Spongiibacter sp. IMCC21906]